MTSRLPADVSGTAGGVETIGVPAWVKLPWLVHGFSTRSGGQSTLYQSRSAGELRGGPSGVSDGEHNGDLNLGFTAEDSREAVLRNRELLLAHLLGDNAIRGQRSTCLVTTRQTHSATVHRVDQTHLLEPCLSPALEGDGLMTDVPGVMLGILTADCVPVLVVDRRRRAVAAFHAGWRGTLQRIVEHGVSRMHEEFGSVPEDLLAAVGPAIGACCYAVGEEMLQQFRSRFPYADELFASTAGDVRLDLAEANRRQLLAAGLDPAALSVSRACTACESDRFFSYRAEHGVTGRMMAVVGVRSSRLSD